MENNMREKTETSVERRDAKTTEAETAAFIDSTEDKLYQVVRCCRYN